MPLLLAKQGTLRLCELSCFEQPEERLHTMLLLLQWFPTYAPRHTSAPRDVIRCAAKNIEVKFNQVLFKKFHAAGVSQYGTLTILLVVIVLFLVGECIIQVYLRLNKVRYVAALCKIMHEINSDCNIYKH